MLKSFWKSWEEGVRSQLKGPRLPSNMARCFSAAVPSFERIMRAGRAFQRLSKAAE